MKKLDNFPLSESEELEVGDSRDIRDKIFALENALLEANPDFHIEPVHYFADGMYAREITIPKGYVVTGAIHKTEHISILSKGRIAVLTEEGIKELTAPCTIISSPGMKRVGYALEESVWTTIHPNEDNIKDVLELEARYTAKSYDELQLEGEEIKILDKSREDLCHT